MNTIRTNAFVITAAAIAVGAIPMAIYMRDPIWLFGLFAFCLFL